MANGLQLRFQSAELVSKILLPKSLRLSNKPLALTEGVQGSQKWNLLRVFARQTSTSDSETFSLQFVHLPRFSYKTQLENPHLRAFVVHLMRGKRQQVVILRGIPGSGKSFIGKQIQHLLWEKYHILAPICSADLFFETTRGYEFDPKGLSSAHQRCRKQFLHALEAAKASSSSAETETKTKTETGLSVILVDNTNTQKWEYDEYESEALANGFEVQIVQVKCPDLLTATRVAKRNSHGVPLDRVLAMFARWEDDNRPFVWTVSPQL
jgi:predicted kinase